MLNATFLWFSNTVRESFSFKVAKQPSTKKAKMTFNEQMPKSSKNYDKPEAMQTMRKIHKVQLYSFELNSPFIEFENHSKMSQWSVSVILSISRQQSVMLSNVVKWDILYWFSPTVRSTSQFPVRQDFGYENGMFECNSKSLLMDAHHRNGIDQLFPHNIWTHLK